MRVYAIDDNEHAYTHKNNVTEETRGHEYVLLLIASLRYFIHSLFHFYSW